MSTTATGLPARPLSGRLPLRTAGVALGIALLLFVLNATGVVPLYRPMPVILAQMSLGLVNGAFYALLSLGLAVIFGMLNIINFAHGALYMLGALVAWGLAVPNEWLGMISPGLQVSDWLQLGYWPALVVAPLVVGAFGLVLERTLLRRIYRLDHLYGLLLTFGVALLLQGLGTRAFGTSGMKYTPPPELMGSVNLGYMFMPKVRLWGLAAASTLCVVTWLLIERTPIGARLRAATENPGLVQAFGVNVPLMISLTYAGGVALAAFAGVLAAPIYNVSPTMGISVITTVFAIVVIGGMGSILGSIVTGFGLGMVEGLTKVYYSQGASVVVFVVMVIVLLLRPSGLFGKAA